MPTPGKKESQKDFISRCIPIVIDDGTAEDPTQARAICYSIWKEKKGTKVTRKHKAAPDMRIFSKVKMAAKDGFYQQIQDAVRRSFPEGPNMPWVYLEDINLDASEAIVSAENGIYYAIPFAKDEAGYYELNTMSKREVTRRTTFENVAKKKATTYDCECLSCGHKVTIAEHCADTPCPKCGKKMRRAARPGVGQARRFLFAYDLLGAKSVEDDGGYWIQLFPAPGTEWQYPTGADAKGKVQYKKLKYSKKQYGQAVTNFEAQDAVELSTNYEHVPKTNSKFSPEEGRASGWLRKLEARADGLWAYWVPTDDAKTFIASKEYRYFSPEWQENATDIHTGKDIGFKLTGGGLTNDPFFEGMAALELAASKEGKLRLFVGQIQTQEVSGMDLKAMAEKLGLVLPEGKDEWSEELFDEALEAKKTAAEAELKAVKEAVDEENVKVLAEKTKEIEELTAKLETEQQASKTDLADAVKKISELEERVKVGEDARSGAAKKKLIEDALAARKIVSEESATAQMLGKTFDRFGEEEARKVLNDLKEQLDAKRHGSGTGSETEVQLTSYEQKLAKSLGLTPEEMLASKKVTLTDESKEIEED